MSAVKRVVVGVVLAGAAVGGVFFGQSDFNPWRPLPEVVAVETETSHTHVIEAVRRTEEIALLSLGIQGISQRSEHSTVFGVYVPGSDRALYIQYNFTAKLRIDGEEVKIEQLEDGTYRIELPEFIFIGHDDIRFQMVTEQNGVLSFATPEIDVLDMTNEILSNEAQQKYLVDNADLLRQQAESFYLGIVRAVEPDAEVVFAYTSDE